MKKYFLNLFIIVCMFMFCDDVFASCTNKIYVANTEVTSSNASDVFGDGKVSYDETNHILTLDNYVINSNVTSGDSYYDGSYYYSIYFDIEEDVTIKFNGSNKINFDISDSDYYGIFSTGNISLIGVGDDASFESNINGTTGCSYLIGSFSETSISNLNIKNTFNGTSEGITVYSDGKINVNNSTFDVKSTDLDFSYCIYAFDFGTITNSSFNINSNNIVTSFAGIYIAADVDITNSNFKIIGTGDISTNEQYGFYSDGFDIIKNSSFDINLKGNQSYGFYLGDAEFSNSKMYSTFDMKTQTDINYGIYVSNYLKIKDSICKLDGTEGTLVGITLILDGGVFVLSNVIDSYDITYNNIELNEVYLSNTSFDDVSVSTSLDDIAGSHYIVISADDSTYEYLEGKDSKFDINKTTSLKLKVDAVYCLFKNMYIDGVKYVLGTDYNVSEGSTVIEFTATGLEKIKKLSIGEHTIETNYLNTKKTTTKINVVEEKEEVKEEEKVVENKTEETIENPKTGDNILINIGLFLISLVSITYFILKKKNINN